MGILTTGIPSIDAGVFTMTMHLPERSARCYWQNMNPIHVVLVNVASAIQPCNHINPCATAWLPWRNLQHEKKGQKYQFMRCHQQDIRSVAIEAGHYL